MYKQSSNISTLPLNCTREESLSLINVEVQGCGTPVVTYQNTGAQETVDNECGFSAENGNAKEFLDIILKIKESGKESFSDNCINLVHNKFNREKNYAKYKLIIKS